MARRGGTAVAVINQGPTAFSDTQLVVDADASVVLPLLADAILDA